MRLNVLSNIVCNPGKPKDTVQALSDLFLESMVANGQKSGASAVVKILNKIKPRVDQYSDLFK